MRPVGRRDGGIRELDFRTALRDRLDASEMEETRVTQCDNCGAQVTFDAQVHAKECPFCATPLVTDTGTHRHIKPQGVIPFQLTERQAHDAMNRWLGRLWFAPNGLAEYAKKGRKMDGIYVPYWTYDADTRTRYTGQRGTAYYVTVRGKDGKPRRVRKMRWTRVSGRVARFFDDVVILASRSLPKRFTDALQPWGLEALTEYRPDYLSGFRAEGYTVDLDEGMEEARGVMDARIRRDIARDIGGDAQRIGVVETRLSDVTFKHILLPVWVAAYRYGGKPYRFVVNGQTGKVQGERPYSADQDRHRRDPRDHHRRGGALRAAAGRRGRDGVRHGPGEGGPSADHVTSAQPDAILTLRAPSGAYRPSWARGSSGTPSFRPADTASASASGGRRKDRENDP
jgi:ribosomal protein S27E